MTVAETYRPKLGFVGVGWIGRLRMDAIYKSGLAEINSIMDISHDLAKEVVNEFSNVAIFDTYDEMLAESGLDGIVIATPSAMHAAYVLAALDKGKAVFCQKPLGRNKKETSEVVRKAKNSNLLLGVDFSYRGTEAMQAIKNVLASEELGSIYAVDLIFHNAYGPDKAWYYDFKLSGGGCLTDLGIHLVDMLFWLLDDPQLTNVCSSLYHKGKKVKMGDKLVEDYAAAQLELNHNINVQLACSWNLPAGKDAVIKATFYGEKGGASFHNINGSFSDFAAERYYGTSTKVLSNLPDRWEGVVAVNWVKQLANSKKFAEDAEDYIKVASLLDAIYENRT